MGLLWDTNAKVDQIEKDLKTIKNKARDQSTLEAGRAIDTDGLKKEMNDQTSKILQNVREAIETRGEKTTERTVAAAGAASKGRDTNEAGQKPSMEEIREQVRQ